MVKQTPDPAAGASRWEAPAAGSSRPANDLSAAAAQLLNGGSKHLDSAALRDALLDLHQFWLSTKATEIGITPTSGFAIVATGGLGRGELLPFSDLDLTLVHDDMPSEIVTQVAELLWYPLWDANIALDHSVRTVPEALEVAGADISAGLAMLDARHIAGDSGLSSALVSGARRQWRTGIASRFEELVEHTQARWNRSGQIAHRAEPELKNGRGGLRAVQLLNALPMARLADVYPSRLLASPTGTLGDAHLAMLNVRTELHRISHRGREMLQAQYADEIGAALRIGDRFDLARTLSDAARTISYYVDAGLRTAANAFPRRGFAALRRPIRKPLDEGVIEFAGEVILARDARPERDPGLILRVAAASATTGLPMSSSTLARLAETAPELRTPWPRQALKDLLVMLAAGGASVSTIEALDRTGLWGRLFPEWGAVRDLPPRDIVHIWKSPSGVVFIRFTRAPSLSACSRASHSRPQTTLMTFQPAPRKKDSSSWMIFPLPRTGPSSRCRLQLMTYVRLSRRSMAGRWIRPRDSTSSSSPSPRNAHTCCWEVSLMPRWCRYRLTLAWAMAFIGPRPIETVGCSQKSGISRGWGYDGIPPPGCDTSCRKPSILSVDSRPSRNALAYIPGDAWPWKNT